MLVSKIQDLILLLGETPHPTNTYRLRITTTPCACYSKGENENNAFGGALAWRAISGASSMLISTLEVG